ncbi:hypothetical protein Hanom_Chr11g01061741 [Helianthus anomalus]
MKTHFQITLFTCDIFQPTSFMTLVASDNTCMFLSPMYLLSFSDMSGNKHPMNSSYMLVLGENFNATCITKVRSKLSCFRSYCKKLLL